MKKRNRVVIAHVPTGIPGPDAVLGVASRILPESDRGRAAGRLDHARPSHHVPECHPRAAGHRGRMRGSSG